METTAKNIQKLLNNTNTQLDNNSDLKKAFDEIIINKLDGYGSELKPALKSFFNDLQHGGCISGMIGEFIYHSDCKDFYITHIDELEDFKTELEDNFGEAIANRDKQPHYTFVCWLCFEEYCYQLYSAIFEQ